MSLKREVTLVAPHQEREYVMRGGRWFTPEADAEFVRCNRAQVEKLTAMSVEISRDSGDDVQQTHVTQAHAAMQPKDKKASHWIDVGLVVLGLSLAATFDEIRLVATEPEKASAMWLAVALVVSLALLGGIVAERARGRP